MKIEDVLKAQDITRLKEIEAIYDKIEQSVEDYVDKFKNLIFLDRDDKKEINIKNNIFKIISSWGSISAIIESSKNEKKLKKNLENSGLPTLDEFTKSLFLLYSDIREFLVDRQEEVKGVINEFFSEEYVKKNFKFCDETSKLDDLYVCVYNLRKSFIYIIQAFYSEAKKLLEEFDEDINIEPSPASILSNINKILISFNRYELREIVETIGNFFDIFKRYDFFKDSKDKIADTELLVRDINMIGTDYTKLDQAFDGFKKFYDTWNKIRTNISEFIKLSQTFQAKLNGNGALEYGRLLSDLIGKELTIRNVRNIRPILSELYFIASQNASEVIEEGKVIEQNPEDPAYHYNKGNELYNLGQYEKAIEEYDQAIKLDQNNPLYHNGKGIALYMLGQYEKAIEEYDQAIKLSLNEPVYHYNKALALYNLGQYEKAIEEYDQAIKLDQNNPLYYYGKSLVLRKLNKFEEAIESAQKALDLSPKTLDYLVLYAELGADLDSSEKGLNKINESIASGVTTRSELCTKIGNELNKVDLNKKEKNALLNIKNIICLKEGNYKSG